MLSALYFPALRPEPAFCEALLALVDRLVCYGAVEGEEPMPGCEVRVVAPLGAELPRFQALLREMTGREAEYFKGQLLALASRPGRDRDEASGWNLSAALRRRSAAPDQGGGEKIRIERLWQARLVLKLAETVKGAEAEIQRELAAVSRREAEILQALRGEDEAEEFLLPPDSGPDPGRQLLRGRKLLGAWAALFSEDQQPEPFLVTADVEAGELLLGEVEKRAPGVTVRLPDLLLPGAAGTAGPARVALANALAGIIAGAPAHGPGALEEAAAGWAQSLAGAGGGQPRLSLYLLPGGPLRQALGALGGLVAAGGVLTAPPLVLLGVATICKD